MAYTLEQRRQHRAACQKPDCWCKCSGKSGKSGKSGEKLNQYHKFVGIDGEALGEEGYHLLAASTGDQIANPDGLSSADCIRFLLGLRKHTDSIFIGYSLAYDCEFWIRDFGPPLWRALKEQGEGTINLDGRRLVISYVPKKWFKIGFYGEKRTIWLIQIYDVFSFFQMSFVNVVGSPATGQRKGWNIATAEEMAVLLEWKAKRGGFLLEEWEQIVAYNQIECAVLVRLANRLRDALYETGIRLRSWHGPGAVADALLRMHGMEEHIPDTWKVIDGRVYSFRKDSDYGRRLLGAGELCDGKGLSGNTHYDGLQRKLPSLGIRSFAGHSAGNAIGSSLSEPDLLQPRSSRASYQSREYPQREMLGGAEVAARGSDTMSAGTSVFDNEHVYGQAWASPVQGVQKTECLPEEIRTAHRCCYFGGRFQVFKVGHLEGVYDYDISSAYPFANTLLPSACGEWIPVFELQESPWALYEVSWDAEGPLSPFPWRDKGGLIHYPYEGRGWYWHWEVAAAMEGWPDGVTIHRGWLLRPTEEGVFSWMNELAAKRVEAKMASELAEGAERDRLLAVERAYKLCLNSVYGKTIQTVGKFHPFLCPMWAGLITAHCRARLLTAALSSNVDTLAAFATDGLFCTARNSFISESKELGGWELAAEGLTTEVYQSGCYAFIKDGEIIDTRFRGVSRADIDWDALREVWEKKGVNGRWKATTKRFVGHRTALARNKPKLQATWAVIEKDIELQPGVGMALEEGDGWCSWQSWNYGVDYTECSAPYRKLSALEEGLTADERELEEVQP
jgi:hypothetical protein